MNNPQRQLGVGLQQSFAALKELNITAKENTSHLGLFHTLKEASGTLPQMYFSCDVPVGS
jgi:hypothetical protein